MDTDSVSSRTPLPYIPQEIQGSMFPSRASPISSLSKEIIASIFLLSAAVAPPSAHANPHNLRRFRMSILSTSSVNRLWRSISLALPHPWAFLLEVELSLDPEQAHCNLDSWTFREKWLEELFRRSNPLPIDIRRTSYPYSLSSALLIKLETGFLSRIRTYRVLLDEDGWRAFVENACRNPAPKLEALALSFVSTKALLFDIFDEPPVAAPRLPKGIFVGHAPRLAELTLKGCAIHWAEDLCRIANNLTSVTVVPRQGWTPTYATADQWIECLRAMPRLNKLVLAEGAISSVLRTKKPSGSILTACNRAALANLSWLCLEGPMDDVGYLLEHLDFPLHCGVSVACLSMTDTSGLEGVRDTFSERFQYCSALKTPSANNSIGPFLSIQLTSRLALVVTNQRLDDDGVNTGEAGIPFLYLLLETDDSEDSDAEIDLAEEAAHNRGVPASIINQRPPVWQALLACLLSSPPMTMAFTLITELELSLPFVPPALQFSLSKADRVEVLSNMTSQTIKKLFPVLRRAHYNEQSICSDVERAWRTGPTGHEMGPLSSLLPILPSLHTINVSNLCPLIYGTSFRHLQSFLAWRALTWRRIRVVEVGDRNGREYARIRGGSGTLEIRQKLEYLGVRFVARV